MNSFTSQTEFVLKIVFAMVWKEAEKLHIECLEPKTLGWRLEETKDRVLVPEF